MLRKPVFANGLTLAPALADAPPAPAVGSRLLLAESNGKPTVEVQRRRKPTSDGDRERADAPERDQPTSSGGSGGGGGSPPSGSGGSGGGRPSMFGGSGGGGRSPMNLGIVALVVLAFICYTAFNWFTGGGNDGGSVDTVVNDGSADDNAQDFVTETDDSGADESADASADASGDESADAAAHAAPVAAGSGDTKWLIMLYQDADDKVLEKDIVVDANEAERAGSTDNVQIVSQLDRYSGGYDGDGNWVSTKRYHIGQDPELETMSSQEIDDLGEVNMADAETLIDFVTWAMENYPADKYVLILSDHGMGWPGGWSDPTASGGGGGNIPLVRALDDHLYLHELDDALGEIRQRTGLDKFEMIGMDACLMAHLEVFSALEPHARYAVASQETEPALGWAYKSFLDALRQNPDMTGAELGKAIVDSYIQDDQRILDDQARADLMGAGRSLGGLLDMLTVPSADQMARQMEENITITTADLEALPALTSAVNDLAFALQGVNQKLPAQARSYAQSFTSIFGRDVPPSYIDIGHFSQLLDQNTSDSNLKQATAGVMDALSKVVIAEKHGSAKSGATGVSIYYPNSQLYGNANAGAASYVGVAARFAEESLWDDFLAYHFTGREFEPDTVRAATIDAGTAVRAPGAGGITVSEITASSDTAAPGQPVTLQVDIGGENVGYVKLFAGFVDQDANSINVTDIDYLESPDTRVVNDVYYPAWPAEEFTMTFEWEPIVFAVDDGNTRAVTAFDPESYGKTFEDATYTVDGIYHYADGETRNAKLYFRNGVLEQVFGFDGDGETGAPREIIPQAGDTFVVLERWMDLNESGEVAQFASEEGETLTFGDTPLTWIDLDAAAGQYVVGFLVEDLDGNQYPTYTAITVQ